MSHTTLRGARIGAAVIAAGGIAAETICFGGYDSPGAAQDLDELRRLAPRTGDGLSADDTVRLYVALASARLREQWQAVEAVRDGLLRHESLDGPSVERLARKAGLGIRTTAQRRRELEPLVVMDPRPRPRLVRVGDEFLIPSRLPFGVSGIYA